MGYIRLQIQGFYQCFLVEFFLRVAFDTKDSLDLLKAQ
jgi:hypothetical protein